MKRLLDILFSVLLLLVLSPLALCIAILVRVMLGAPVLFYQKRPGLHGTPFTLVKFRTMRVAREGEKHGTDDALRLSSFGRFLRASSLDELPSLWNILRGEMSFVGPRPLLMDYLPLYSEQQMRRHDVRPGLTGWAQINGRNAQSWDERFRNDLWYVDNRSWFLDLKILGLTIVKVLKREGTVEMPPFK